MIDMLKEKIISQRNGELKESWIQLCSEMPIYQSPEICKMLLISAFHDKYTDEDNPGILKPSAKDAVSTFNYNFWKKFNLDGSEKLTIEHIGPQTYTAEWDKSLDNSSLLHSLGNLTILPLGLNSAVKNKKWEVKRKVFSLLSQINRNPDTDAEQLLSPSQIQQIKNTPYLGFLNPIAGLKNWDATIVKQRSDNLLGSAFDQLFNWLE
jgi:hypothetical protein